MARANGDVEGPTFELLEKTLGGVQDEAGQLNPTACSQEGTLADPGRPRSSRQKPYLSPILHPSIPSSLLPYLSSSTSHDTYLKSQSYASDKLSCGSVLALLDQLESLVLLTSIAAPLYTALGFGAVNAVGWPFIGENGWTLLKGFWDVAGRFPGATTELKQSMAFVAVLTTVGTILAAPKAFYKTFVLEEKHGFNKTTRGTFVADQIKGACVRCGGFGHGS